MQDDYSSTGIAITIVTFFLQTIILPSAPFFLPDHGPRSSRVILGLQIKDTCVVCNVHVLC